MANLFWRTKKRTKALLDKPFKTEAYYKIETGKTKVIDFLPVFEFAYRKLAGSGGD